MEKSPSFHSPKKINGPRSGRTLEDLLVLAMSLVILIVIFLSSSFIYLSYYRDHIETQKQRLEEIYSSYTGKIEPVLLQIPQKEDLTERIEKLKECFEEETLFVREIVTSELENGNSSSPGSISIRLDVTGSWNSIIRSLEKIEKVSSETLMLDEIDLNNEGAQIIYKLIIWQE